MVLVFGGKNITIHLVGHQSFIYVAAVRKGFLKDLRTAYYEYFTIGVQHLRQLQSFPSKSPLA
jgi:hypothetical protein